MIFLPHSLPSRDPPIHPSIDRPATMIARTSLPRSLALHMPPSPSTRFTRESTNERQRDPEGANNAHDEECALATLINEVLRLNGGTVSSVRVVGMSRHGF